MASEADAIEHAVHTALNEGLLTGDMMADGCRLASCTEMGDAIVTHI